MHYLYRMAGVVDSGNVRTTGLSVIFFFLVIYSSRLFFWRLVFFWTKYGTTNDCRTRPQVWRLKNNRYKPSSFSSKIPVPSPEFIFKLTCWFDIVEVFFGFVEVWERFPLKSPCTGVRYLCYNFIYVIYLTSNWTHFNIQSIWLNVWFVFRIIIYFS